MGSRIYFGNRVSTPSVAKPMAPEVAAGPPMRGAPWLEHVFVEPVAHVALPVPPSVDQQYRHVGEIFGGPAMRGVPWQEHLPIEPMLRVDPPGTVPDFVRNQAYPREIHAGPAMRGAPWLQNIPVEPTIVQGPPPPLVITAIPAPEIHGGPPLRGAPWLQQLPITPFVPTPNPPIPPTPVTPVVPKWPPTIQHDPAAPPRTRKHMDMVADIFNSLMRQGLLYLDANGGWQVVSVTSSDRFVEARPPTVNDDASHGARAGSVWVDTSTSNVYLCASANIGSAVWKLAG